MVNSSVHLFIYIDNSNFVVVFIDNINRYLKLNIRWKRGETSENPFYHAHTLNKMGSWFPAVKDTHSFTQFAI
jgi:hypothetical protein